MIYDRDLDKPGRETIAFLDIGTRSSDLIVIADGHCWIRTFPIGGHHFTEAVATAFSVPYGKADRLKAEAATHKYAKQLMHAMRPVFDDLLQEVQRSIGHFQSIRPEKPIARIVGLGSTFRIPGLRKFLSDQLSVDIRRQEEFTKIRVEGSAAADFSANAMNLATAIGLALQGLGHSEIAINLSPVENMREQVWRTKSKWFAAAAVLVVAASALQFWRPGGAVGNEIPTIVRTAKSEGDAAKRQFEAAQTAADLGARANNMVFLLEDREVWPWIVNDIYSAVGTAGTQAELLGAFDPKNPPIPYEEWRLIEIDNISGRYALNASVTPNAAREISVALDLTVPRPTSGANGAPEFIQRTVLDWLNKNANRPSAPYTIVIPEKGIVASFKDRNAKDGGSGSGSGSAQSGGTTGFPEDEVVQNAGTTNTGQGQTAFEGRRKGTGEQIAAPGGGILSGAGGPPIGPQGSEDTTGAGGRPANRRPTREIVKSGNRMDPVDLEKDAVIPSRPDIFEGRVASNVRIVFTVRLKDPQGRSTTGQGATPEAGAAAPAEGDPQ
ncbi:MAG: pilus assembly protein PilM, partial [Phycisphaerae bacterium]|nr:pilus assembly protein PilM [Phycisphaerae bacterium]